MAGVGANLIHYGLYHLGFVRYQTEMAANVYIIIVGWLTGFLVAVGLSLITEPRPVSELEGLVYSLAQALRSEPIHWSQSPRVWGMDLLSMMGLLAWIFW